MDANRDNLVAGTLIQFRWITDKVRCRTFTSNKSSGRHHIPSKQTNWQFLPQCATETTQGNGNQYWMSFSIDYFYLESLGLPGPGWSNKVSVILFTTWCNYVYICLCCCVSRCWIASWITKIGLIDEDSLLKHGDLKLVIFTVLAF